MTRCVGATATRCSPQTCSRRANAGTTESMGRRSAERPTSGRGTLAERARPLADATMAREPDASASTETAPTTSPTTARRAVAEDEATAECPARRAESAAEPARRGPDEPPMTPRPIAGRATPTVAAAPRTPPLRESRPRPPCAGASRTRRTCRAPARYPGRQPRRPGASRPAASRPATRGRCAAATSSRSIYRVGRASSPGRDASGRAASGGWSNTRHPASAAQLRTRRSAADSSRRASRTIVIEVARRSPKTALRPGCSAGRSRRPALARQAQHDRPGRRRRRRRPRRICATWCAATASVGSDAFDEVTPESPPVLIIHGFLGTRGSMYMLERRLVEDGFVVRVVQPRHAERPRHPALARS